MGDAGGVPPPADYIAPLDSLNVVEVDLSQLGGMMLRERRATDAEAS